MSRRRGRAGAPALGAAAVGALCALVAVRDAAGYHVMHVGTEMLARAWPARRAPVPFRIDRCVAKDDPDLLPLLRDGALAWNGLEHSYAALREYGWSSDCTTVDAVQSARALYLVDGIPEIAVDYDGAVFDFLGIDREIVTGVGVTEVATLGTIVDGFVLLNGTVALSDGGDITREIVAHEAGHLLGFGHTGVTDRWIAATGPVFPTMAGATGPGILSADDVAVAGALYPDCAFEAETGAIAGTVVRPTMAGSRGVSVTAVSTDGTVAAGALTGTFDDAGSYAIAGLPPGDYRVYIEPLDGTREGDGRSLERIDAFFDTGSDVGFEPEGFSDVLPGSGGETVITVEAGRTATGVDFVLGRGDALVPMPAAVDGALAPIPVQGPNNALPLGGGPLADFAVDATTVLVGTPVSFDGSASRSCAGAIATWTWDFGDGSAQVTGVTATHTFGTTGLFDVVLVVTDDTGATGNHPLSIAVVDTLPPEPEPRGGCGCAAVRPALAPPPWVALLAAALVVSLRFVSNRRRRVPGRATRRALISDV